MEASDQELIAGCLKGDGTAWNQFVERFAKLVHWSIRRSFEKPPPGGSEDFCREVFQDFFHRLIDKNELLKLREIGNLRKFLSVMACHLAIDRLRTLTRHANKMRPVEDLLDEDETLPVVFPDDQDPSPGLLDSVLEDSLKDLSAKERACLQFFIVEGRTAAQTGQILGISESNVHSVVRRSKEKLKTKLIQNGHKNI